MRRAAGYSSALQVPVPMLPGHDCARRPGDDARKSSIFRYINGIPTVVEKVAIDAPSDDTVTEREQADNTRNWLCTTSSAANDPPRTQQLPTQTLPAWLQYDRQTLKFTAYFKESVPESPVENWRVRRCNLLYYLEDGTMQLVEPREENSGLQQGTLLRRHKASYQDGRTLHWRHLSVGASLQLYSRTYYLTGCDEWTRGWMQKQGLLLAPNQASPEGPYDAHVKEQRTRAQESVVQPTPLPMFLPQQKPVNYQRYVDLDRKVLRFYSCWDDSASELGDKLPYVIHYYLTDDSIEVREVRLRNDGRDPFPMLLHRTKLPSFTPPVGARPMSPTSRNDLAKHYYHWRDLRIGSSIQVYGRTMFIFDCDKFTRQWYQQHSKLSAAQLAPIKVVFEYNPKAPPPCIPPNELGIGSEEDSLQNVFNLVPKAPTHDYRRYKEVQGIVLRYAARMAAAPGLGGLGPFDAERRFVLSYYPVDGTLCIFEPPRRNSGLQGGMYLERTKVVKPPSQQQRAPPGAWSQRHALQHSSHVLGPLSRLALGASTDAQNAQDAVAAISQAYYSEKDLHIGAVLSVYKRGFVITEADEFTLQYLEQYPDRYPWASYELVVNKIQQHLRQQGKGAMDSFPEAVIHADQYGNGLITGPALQAVLTKVDLHLNDHEVMTLIRKIGTNELTLPAVVLIKDLGLDQ